MTENVITLQIGGALELILRPPEQPKLECIVKVSYEGFTVTAKGDHMAYTLPVDHYITVRVSYVDSAGNPAVVDGDVVWTSSNEQVATINVDASDDTVCKVTPTSQLGTSQIVATADADLGAGVKELITTLDLSVVAGEAVAGTINVVGDPQPIK